MAFGTRPALDRVRVNGASTTRFGKRQSPNTRGSSRVGIEVLAFRKSCLAYLPGGASRLIQRADGYVATIKGGTVTFAEGEHTGATPGALLRGAR